MDKLGPEFYDKFVTQFPYSDLLKHAEESIPIDIKRQLADAEKANVLVLGTATVTDTIRATARFQSDLRGEKAENDQLVIVDLNQVPLQKGKASVNKEQQFSDLPPAIAHKMQFIQADMKHLPFLESSFAIVASNFTLNYTDNEAEIEQVIIEIGRILSDNGILILSIEGNSEDLSSTEYGVMQQFSKPRIDQTRSYDITQYPFALVQKIAGVNGLRLLSLERQNPWGLNKRLVFRGVWIKEINSTLK